MSGLSRRLKQLDEELLALGVFGGVIFSAVTTERLMGSLRMPHRGGNITGLSVMATDLSAKRVGLLQMVVPRIHNIAVLWDSSSLARARNQRSGAVECRGT